MDIVQTVRQEFGEGNDFCRKITNAAKNPKSSLAAFRNDYNPRIAVTVDMIATGTDVKPLECLLVRKGTLMDATLVSSASRPPPYKAGAGARHPREPDADWTLRNGKAFFGYKAHVGVDRGSSLVRRAGMTSAKIYESTVADGLISGDEAAAFHRLSTPDLT